MESWVRYSVAVYVGLLLAGAVMQREDAAHTLPARVQLSQQQEQLQMMLYEAQLQAEPGRRGGHERQPRG